ncbi:metallophosphoesterase [Aureimonas frigidaquae]|uniref:metallophosphoesterase n=1 Tax=Aureimonas frigidaquae TaxID=424757 RepID=UPI00078423E0|nr:metallophosphoesterase [Aureimonas frigidaquae]
MRIELLGAQAELLGDPHLGRQFINGVPLHRRNDREASVLADFKASLAKAGEVDLHVCMGDLFDKWYVPYTTIATAALAYLEAARSAPGCTFIILAGNHDVSRDMEKKGGFDLFAMIVASVPNIVIVRDKPHYEVLDDGTAGFFPYHLTETAASLITQPLDAAFGHWDTIFGDGNMIPTKELADMGCATAYTGHVHLPERFKRHNVDVVVVGSLQPYAHGEDHGEMYVTLTSDALEGRDLADKCVRIQLKPGEVFDQTVDCLQLTFKRPETTATEEVEVSMGDFNMAALFAQAFDEEDVPEKIRTALLTKFEEARVKE